MMGYAVIYLMMIKGVVQEQAGENENSLNIVFGDEMKNLEILKKYKELLDMGAISQAEYDKKKSEILS
jgi:hypothetical protein